MRELVSGQGSYTLQHWGYKGAKEEDCEGASAFLPPKKQEWAGEIAGDKNPRMKELKEAKIKEERKEKESEGGDRRKPIEWG